MKYFLNYSIILILLVSCMPKEEAVDPFDRGSVNTEELSTGDTKDDILFYDLENAELVATARPSDWDIEFTQQGLRINPFRQIEFANYTGDLLTLHDTTGLVFTTGQYADRQWTMDIDSQYVIDLSKVGTGSHLGIYKLKLEENNGLYTLHYAELSADVWKTNSLELHDYFNMRTSDYSTHLPAEHSYDIAFGKYIHYFPVEKVYYEVFGALTATAEVARVADDFTSITATTADTISWPSSRFDHIGFDWKEYNLQKGAYEIDATANFVIRNRSGFLYKFRFTSFYDGAGQSGHPTFEYQLL